MVLERRHIFGGAAVTEEFAPGFRASIFSYVMSILHPRIIADLELRQFGLEVLPANDLFCPLWNDDHLIFADDVAKTQASFARFSKKDAEAYPAFDAYLQDSRRRSSAAAVPDAGRPDPHRLAPSQGDRPASLGVPEDRQRSSTASSIC